jgi:hypothetical protein
MMSFARLLSIRHHLTLLLYEYVLHIILQLLPIVRLFGRGHFFFPFPLALAASFAAFFFATW